MEYIEFEGQIYWKITDAIEEWNYEVENELPSSFRKRTDLNFLLQDDVPNADLYHIFFEDV